MWLVPDLLPSFLLKGREGVFALWLVPDLLPSFLLKGGEISRYVLSGADLMASGWPAEGLPEFRPGEVWSVKVPGNSCPIAVSGHNYGGQCSRGRESRHAFSHLICLISPHPIRPHVHVFPLHHSPCPCTQVGITMVGSAEAVRAGMRGKLLRITHYYRDSLWGTAEGSYVPNKGFLPDLAGRARPWRSSFEAPQMPDLAGRARPWRSSFEAPQMPDLAGRARPWRSSFEAPQMPDLAGRARPWRSSFEAPQMPDLAGRARPWRSSFEAPQMPDLAGRARPWRSLNCSCPSALALSHFLPPSCFPRSQGDGRGLVRPKQGLLAGPGRACLCAACSPALMLNACAIPFSSAPTHAHRETPADSDAMPALLLQMEHHHLTLRSLPTSPPRPQGDSRGLLCVEQGLPARPGCARP
ncbi:unnamed protein product [Closterium sp. NIES-65]|nr:unnamed protein product [Closterium sp. NIES-65]